MAMTHWANEEVSTQVMWNLENELKSHLEGMEEDVEARPSEGEPAMFFQVDGGEDAQEMGDNDYGYDIVFEVADFDNEEEVGEGIEFRISNDNVNVEDVVFPLDVVKRTVDGVEIYAVDADTVFTKFKEFFYSK